MATTATPGAMPAIQTSRDQFLATYEREHATTMRVLRAFPPDQVDLRPHERCKTARELAWVFVVERGLGQLVMNDAFAHGMPAGEMPKPPESWNEILEALESAHKDFGDLMRAIPEQQLVETVKFFTGPKTLGDVRRIDFAWFLLHDQIHHRGQFSIYLRVAGAKVPSIYGPTADEPWI